MAVRHRLIRKRPEDVWAVLADAAQYGDWVVGTAHARPDEGEWPELGSSLRYEIKAGPVTLHNRTVVRRSEPLGALELEVDSGPLGSARIALELRPWGEYTLVIFDEHPLSGLGGFLHNGLVDLVQQVRHRVVLRRLARLCEGKRAPAGSRARPRAGRA